MLDRYIFGQVDRISPEAPVPVVKVAQDKTHLGGAGNVARNLKQLGGEPVLVSVCGDDDDAALLRQTCDREGVQAHLVQDPSRPTTVKTRVIAHSQQVVRIDREAAHPDAPSVSKALLETISKHGGDAAAVIISDYAKGVITPEFVQGLRTTLQDMNPDAPVLVDPKPRNLPLFDQAFLMTPNAKEAAQAGGLEVLDTPEQILRAADAILTVKGRRNLCITLGPRGMALFLETGQVAHISALAQQVFDVTGAGDTVIAMLGLATAAGHDLLVGTLLANYAAGIVVGEIGAASTTQEAIAAAIRRWDMPEVSIWREGRNAL